MKRIGGLIGLVLLVVTASAQTPPHPTTTATPTRLQEDTKCLKELATFNQANKNLNVARQALREAPGPVAGMPTSSQAAQESMGRRMIATAAETDAVAAYERARSEYMACEQGGVR